MDRRDIREVPIMENEDELNEFDSEKMEFEEMNA